MIRYFVHRPGQKTTMVRGVEGIEALLAEPDTLLWLDIQAPGKEEERLFSEVFKLHPLVVEDIFVENQVAKMDAYGDDLFSVFKLLDYQGGEDDLKITEVDIYASSNFVITIHKQAHRVFEFLFSKVMQNERMMSRGSDLLLHALVDAAIDSYNITLDVLESQVDEIEETVLEEPDGDIVRSIFRLRRHMAMLKRVAGPQKESLHRLSRGNLTLVSDRAQVYFRDIYDNVNRIIDIADSNRETLSAALEVYFSSVSTKTNEVIKFLTFITVLLMPPTFLAGLWGMNFTSMPELNWEHGYLFFWIVTIITTASMVIFFKKKKWL